MAAVEAEMAARRRHVALGQELAGVRNECIGQMESMSRLLDELAATAVRMDAGSFILKPAAAVHLWSRRNCCCDWGFLLLLLSFLTVAAVLLSSSGGRIPGSTGGRRPAAGGG